jgi:3-oxoadipate enol-lactonase
MHTIEADIGCGVLRGRIEGQGSVVCLLSTLGGTWFEQVRKLRGKYRVLTYDLRGFGSSLSRKSGYATNEEHADDLAQLLTCLGLQRIVLVGLSHGGAVAQHFAIKHCRFLGGLVLVSSVARATGPTLIFLRLLHGFLQRGELETFWEILKAFLCSEARRASFLRREGYFKRQLFDQYTSESLAEIYASALNQDTREGLRRVYVPTLVVGGREDLLFPPATTAELATLVPGSSHVLLDAAHVPPLETPELFNGTLENFLRSVSDRT